jgi:hypothetical protein
MLYTNNVFEYYSDNTIPYRYLEVVARKYVKIFKCRQIYIDMNEHIELYTEKIKKENIENTIKQKQEEELTKKNVFAKFKSYNKDTNSGRTLKNNVPQMYDVDTNNVVKDTINRYLYKGKMSNFSILQKIDRKIVDKKYAMKYSDFKNIKNKN